MNIKIRQTGEIKKLKIIGLNGIEWTNDLLGNANADMSFDEESEVHVMDTETFEWWEKYIENCKNDDAEQEELRDELIDAELVAYEIIYDITCEVGSSNDFNDHHDERQYIFNMIRRTYLDK